MFSFFRGRKQTDPKLPISKLPDLESCSHGIGPDEPIESSNSFGYTSVKPYWERAGFSNSFSKTAGGGVEHVEEGNTPTWLPPYLPATPTANTATMQPSGMGYGVYHRQSSRGSSRGSSSSGGGHATCQVGVFSPGGVKESERQQPPQSVYPGWVAAGGGAGAGIIPPPASAMIPKPMVPAGSSSMPPPPKQQPLQGTVPVGGNIAVKAGIPSAPKAQPPQASPIPPALQAPHGGIPAAPKPQLPPASPIQPPLQPTLAGKATTGGAASLIKAEQATLPPGDTLTAPLQDLLTPPNPEEHNPTQPSNAQHNPTQPSTAQHNLTQSNSSIASGDASSKSNGGGAKESASDVAISYSRGSTGSMTAWSSCGGSAVRTGTASGSTVPCADATVASGGQYSMGKESTTSEGQCSGSSMKPNSVDDAASQDSAATEATAAVPVTQKLPLAILKPLVVPMLPLATHIPTWAGTAETAVGVARRTAAQRGATEVLMANDNAKPAAAAPTGLAAAGAMTQRPPNGYRPNPSGGMGGLPASSLAAAGAMTQRPPMAMGMTPRGAGGGLPSSRWTVGQPPKTSQMSNDTSVPEALFEELVFLQQIGEGGFGKVYHGQWRGESVAIKLANMQSSTPSEQRVKEFKREVGTMSTIPLHVHILKLLGACTTSPNLALITEFCPRGSLFGLIHSPTQALPPMRGMLEIWRGVAVGMAHLHSHRVLHRDLKSANILLHDQHRVKIADFGLSKIHQLDTNALTGGLGTYQWMAPEVLAHQRYSTKADVFAFAIVMWECLTKQLPYHGMSAVQAAVGVVNHGLRPVIPSFVDADLAALIKACWAAVPDQRPPFESVAASLAKMIAQGDASESAGSAGADSRIRQTLSAEGSTSDDNSVDGLGTKAAATSG
eukprot:gene18272-24725_t